MFKFHALPKQLAIFFVGLFLLYALAPRYVGHGHASRYDLTRAIVEDHSFKIDRFQPNTIDWSFKDGHYYTNKAPGVSMLAAPFYAVMLQIEKLLNKNGADWWYRNLRWSDIFVTALPSVVLSWLLYLSMQTAAPHALAGYALATLAFPISTMLWGHQTAAAFLFFSFYAFAKRQAYAWAGLFFGLAVLTEYSCALAAPAFLVFHRLEKRPQQLKAILQFAAGGIGPLFVFVAYHKICFGGFLELAPKYQNAIHNPLPDEEGFRLFGVLALPSPRIIFELLFGVKRGLFLIFPVTAFSILGFVRWFKDRSQRSEAVFALWVVLGFLFFNASYNGWHGGGSSGPRYLVPMLPFLALALSYVKASPLFYGALAVSVVNTAAIMAVETQAPPEFALLSEFIYPNLVASAESIRKFVGVLLAQVVLIAILFWPKLSSRLARSP